MDNNAIRDTFQIALGRARELKDASGLVGYGVVSLWDERGALKQAVPFANLITDAGDLYYADKAIVGIAPANATAPTAVTGMKLGTGTTAAAKNGAGAALITYLSGSNQAFDATYPSITNLGAGLGVEAVYQVTYAAGVATNAAITEAVIVNDSASNLTSSAANTISRIVFTAVNKGAADTLAITWNHKFLGA